MMRGEGGGERPTQEEMAAARRAKKALRAKPHGEGGDRASAAQITAGDDNRIFCDYAIGRVQRECASRPSIVMVNYGVKAAGHSEDTCRAAIAGALDTLPPRAAPGTPDARQPTFLRVCDSKVCFTFADVGSAEQACGSFQFFRGPTTVDVKCGARLHTVLPALPSVRPRPRLALSWKEYTRYNGMSLAEVHSEHSAGGAVPVRMAVVHVPTGLPECPGSHLSLVLSLPERKRHWWNTSMNMGGGRGKIGMMLEVGPRVPEKLPERDLAFAWKIIEG